MIINEVLVQLETSTHPVAKVIHKGEHFKVLAIGLKKGMLLKEHKTALPAKLLVLYGCVHYKEDENIKKLNKYDDIDIPMNKTHSIECMDDALCLLTQG